jgi:RNase adaptor protein for sRNA GlmZ degradation
LTEYTDDEFIEVVKFCLDNLPAETAEIIAKILLSHEKKDVRTAISISNLIQQNDTMEDIARVIENYLKYSTQKVVDYN